MPHQNALFRTDMLIHAEVAVPVRDATIYATMPFHVLPKSGDKIWLWDDIDLVVDCVEFIFHELKPPYITICCKRMNAADHDKHINRLNKFGFDVISAFAKHVE